MNSRKGHCYLWLVSVVEFLNQSLVHTAPKLTKRDPGNDRNEKKSH